MGLREVGGGVWINPKELEEGEIALDKAKFQGFADNENGTFCQFTDEDGETVNVGGKTLISACEKIAAGDKCRLTYKGITKFKNGRKGHMWKLEVYEDDDHGSDESVSTEEESEAPAKKKKAAKKTSKKASKKKASTKKKAAEPEDDSEDEEEHDDMDELDNLE